MEQPSLAGTRSLLNHVRAHSQCFACGCRFKENDVIVALLEDRTNRCRILKNLKHPGDYSKDHNGHVLCREPACVKCELSWDAQAVLHAVCFSLYIQMAKSQDKERLLLAAGATSLPWDRSSVIILPPRLDKGVAVDLIARFDGLQRLPAEIISMIMEHLTPCPLLRILAVMDLVDFLSTQDDNKATLVPLRDIQSWHRGSRLVAAESHEKGSRCLFEVAIDFRGVRHIRRLSAPETTSESASTVYTIIEDPSRLVKFKSGTARFCIPTDAPFPQIWNLSNPPPYRDRFARFRVGNAHQEALTAIDLSTCTGITLFYSEGIHFATHGHTPAAPSALSTYNRLTRLSRKGIVWVYTPIAQADELASFGLRFDNVVCGYPVILFQLRLAGSVSIGSWRKRHFMAVEMTDPIRPSARAHLVHTNPDDPSYTSPRTWFLGISHAEPGVNDALEGMARGAATHPSTHSATRAPNVPRKFLVNSVYCSAPLAGLSALSVFRDPGNRFCRGLLLKYANGAERALGSCRIGVDPVQHYPDPSVVRFCSANLVSETRMGHRRVKVGIPDEPERRWREFSPAGELHIWVTHEEMVAHVKNPAQEVVASSSSA